MAYISNLVWVRKDEVSASQLALAKQTLTITPKASPMGEVPQKIVQYYEERDEIGVPFAFFETYWGHLNIEKENLSEGSEILVSRLPNPLHPKSPPNQKEFFDNVVDAVQDHYTVLAVAPTGSGKTVCLLHAIGVLGRSALVVVPSSVLADQWREEAMLHLGLEWNEIGMLQGSSSNWENKTLVIAVIHNLFLKEWPEKFYTNFGFVAWDECHRLGGAVFAETMPLFNAKYKIAVTATPNRKDGCDALYKNYFGKPLVKATAKALACDCYVVPFNHIGNKHHWISNCKVDAKPMMWLSKLEVRNDMIARLSFSLYEQGRSIVIITKFIEHVEEIIRRLIKLGIPELEIGQFTRSTSSNKKFGKGALDRVKAESKIIVATYSMMKEGVDIPRLDCGIEALPAADNIQAIGRIRRPLPDKKKPKWFSISDLRIPLFEAYTKCRLRGFESTNVTIKHLEQGVV
jgi:superfamily II DNA or RNA helicase